MQSPELEKLFGLRATDLKEINEAQERLKNLELRYTKDREILIAYINKTQRSIETWDRLIESIKNASS